jgi:hypothetical protein
MAWRGPPSMQEWTEPDRQDRARLLTVYLLGYRIAQYKLSYLTMQMPGFGHVFYIQQTCHHTSSLTIEFANYL